MVTVYPLNMKAASSPKHRYVFTMQFRTELNWITQFQYFTQQFSAHQYLYRTVASTLFDRTCPDGWISDCEALHPSYRQHPCCSLQSLRHCATTITHYRKSFQKQTFWSRLQKMSRQTASLFCSNKRFNDDDSNSDQFSHYKINSPIKHARHKRQLTRTYHFTLSRTWTNH
jgi:hypothetical protein